MSENLFSHYSRLRQEAKEKAVADGLSQQAIDALLRGILPVVDAVLPETQEDIFSEEVDPSWPYTTEVGHANGDEPL